MTATLPGTAKTEQIAAEAAGTDAESPSPRQIAEHMGSINPVFQYMGIVILEARAGGTTMRLPLRTDLGNTFGIGHGGTLFALADMCMGFAANCYNERAVTASAEVQFLRPGIVGEDLIAQSNEIWRDRRNAIYDVKVTRPDGETVLLLRGRMRYVGGPVLTVDENLTGPEGL